MTSTLPHALCTMRAGSRANRHSLPCHEFAISLSNVWQVTGADGSA